MTRVIKRIEKIIKIKWRNKIKITFLNVNPGPIAAFWAATHWSLIGIERPQNESIFFTMHIRLKI